MWIFAWEYEYLPCVFSDLLLSVSFNLFLQKSQITLTGEFVQVMVIDANAEDTEEFKSSKGLQWRKNQSPTQETFPIPF